jgi:hypothetical protein
VKENAPTNPHLLYIAAGNIASELGANFNTGADALRRIDYAAIRTPKMKWGA